MNRALTNNNMNNEKEKKRLENLINFERQILDFHLDVINMLGVKPERTKTEIKLLTLGVRLASKVADDITINRRRLKNEYK
jgi:hypothetical protein